MRLNEMNIVITGANGAVATVLMDYFCNRAAFVVGTVRQLAENIGHPKAARAVANACGANPNPIVVPCHRVIRSDGELGGYSGPGGIEQKRELLREEGVNLI